MVAGLVSSDSGRLEGYEWKVPSILSLLVPDASFSVIDYWIVFVVIITFLNKEKCLN